MHCPSAAWCIICFPQAEIEAALEALSTLTDVTVSCDTGLLCDTAAASLCTVEFLTELGDVPMISRSVSNVDSVTIAEFQVRAGKLGPRKTSELELCRLDFVD